MIGYFKKGKWRNGYGIPIKCFKCGSNKCIGSKSFSMRSGGNGELTYCKDHEEDAIAEVKRRDDVVSVFNMNTSGS